MDKFLEILGLVLIIVVFGFLFGWVVMLLWNRMMPMLFGLTTISYWEACCLYVLCGLLFKSTNTNTKKD